MCEFESVKWPVMETGKLPVEGKPGIEFTQKEMPKVDVSVMGKLIFQATV